MLPKSRAFTLIEMVIVLAVLAILAAVMVPLISSNVESAKTSAALSDATTLGKAVIQFTQDLGVWPILENSGGTPISRQMLAGPGLVPQGGSVPWSGHSTLALDYHLTMNGMGYSRGPSPQGLPAWNGPYLSALHPDPWRNAYLVNAAYLPGGTSHDPNRRVWVLSAGPDGIPQTPFDGSSTDPQGDDIAFRLQ